LDGILLSLVNFISGHHVSEIEKQTVDILGHITEGVCRALKVLTPFIFSYFKGKCEVPSSQIQLIRFFWLPSDKSVVIIMIIIISRHYVLGLPKNYNSLNFEI